MERRHGPSSSPNLGFSAPSSNQPGPSSPRNRLSTSIPIPSRSSGSFSSQSGLGLSYSDEHHLEDKRPLTKKPSANSLGFGTTQPRKQGMASLGALLRSRWRHGRARLLVIGVTLALAGWWYFSQEQISVRIGRVEGGEPQMKAAEQKDTRKTLSSPQHDRIPVPPPKPRPIGGKLPPTTLGETNAAPDVKVVDVDVWPSRKSSAPTKPTAEERFLIYSPHSGYHNQRISLENAFTLAFILKRTLVLPPVWLGHAIPYVQFDKLQRRLQTATKDGLERCKEIGEGGSDDPIPRECTGYFDWTQVHWDFLVDLSPARELVKTLDCWNLTNPWFEENLALRPFSSGGKPADAASPDIFYLKDATMYQYRMYDSPEDEEPLAKFENRLDLKKLTDESDSFKAVHVGTLFGTSRLHVQDEENFNARSTFRESMVFRNSLLDEITNEIRDRLGGPTSYYGLHLRVGDGIFQKNAGENMAGVWTTLCVTKMKLEQSLCDEMEAASKERKLLRRAVEGDGSTSSTHDMTQAPKPSSSTSSSGEAPSPTLKLRKRGNSRPQREGAYHHAPLPPVPPIRTRQDSPLDKSLSCRRPLHTDPRYLAFNTPLFIATDSKVPAIDRNIALFFDAFPCTFIISDFSSTSNLNTRVVEGLTRLAGLRNADDNVPLAQFLYPQLDAQIAAYGRALVGTPQSTYSRFAVDVLHQVYHGWDIVERG
ncbi:hypothetical protein T439DRAFT_300452 [Meredithblackwellia eburnea MCA 4105]